MKRLCITPLNMQERPEPPSIMSIVDINIPKLIECVKKRRALYDTSSRLYRDKGAKKKLWDEVCLEMCTLSGWQMMSKKDQVDYGYEIQKKWNSLRSCFRREIVQQHRASKEPGRGKRKRKYYYFNSLMFLLPFTDKVVDGAEAHESALENDPNDDPYPIEDPLDNQDDNNYYSDSNEATQLSEEIILPVDTIKEEIVSSGTKTPEEVHIETEPRSSNRGNISTQIAESSSSNSNILGKEFQVKVETVNEDEADVLFLQSLLPTMREFTSDQKLMLRIEIMRTILKFKQEQAPQ